MRSTVDRLPLVPLLVMTCPVMLRRLEPFVQRPARQGQPFQSCIAVVDIVVVAGLRSCVVAVGRQPGSLGQPKSCGEGVLGLFLSAFTLDW
ncbi:MAG: hypothetical protein J3Q66DRAFT_141925 [Benniella sp.]|nr:MAG: hypothetical protein J3Q66DRAFT_141925 [Benniella sp.]